MNASKLRISRGHRARAAINKANYEKDFVNLIHLRSQVKSSMNMPAGVKLIAQYETDHGRSWDVMIEAPTHMSFKKRPGDYFEVISSKRRRRT
jgi:hypothetical protein